MISAISQSRHTVKSSANQPKGNICNLSSHTLQQNCWQVSLY